jgi:hypothetical protein
MPEVAVDERDRKPLLPTIVKPRERPDRPPPCRVCRAPSWWNGWRVIFPVVAGLVTGVLERWELPLPLAKCAECRHGFTCYPDGIYPRRQYQLDVVAGTVAAVTLGGASVAETARTTGAGSTSVRRWVGWVAKLAALSELVALAVRIDPDAPAGAGLATMDHETTTCSRAALVLAALEHLGLALVHRGLALAARTGLGRVLGWQHAVHGDVYGLVAGLRQLSPAMALGGRSGGP